MSHRRKMDAAGRTNDEMMWGHWRWRACWTLGVEAVMKTNIGSEDLWHECLNVVPNSFSIDMIFTICFYQVIQLIVVVAITNLIEVDCLLNASGEAMKCIQVLQRCQQCREINQMYLQQWRRRQQRISMDDLHIPHHPEQSLDLVPSCCPWTMGVWWHLAMAGSCTKFQLPSWELETCTWHWQFVQHSPWSS